MLKKISLIISFLNIFLLTAISKFTKKLNLKFLDIIICKAVLKNVNKSLQYVNNLKPSNYSQLTKKNEMLIHLHQLKFTLEAIIEN